MINHLQDKKLGDGFMFLKTKEVYEDLCQMMPGGVSSPVRALYGAKRLPLIVQSAYQDIVEDIDQKKYIDFCASWGALILGHSDPELMNQLSEHLKRGTSYGITGIYEHKLAKKINQIMPHIEMMRFCSSGTEATMFALRLARGFTGKDFIVKFVGNYHGGADFLLTEAGSGYATFGASSEGIPKESVQYTLNLPYNDLNALETLFNDPKYKGKIAAVIIEPIAANMGVVPCDKKYMKALREITEKNETLLIFDEVVTGFRISLKGASEYFEVTPDLTCLGKVVGGGFPAAVYGGKKEIMEKLSPLGPVYQGGTLSGNPLAMAAGYYVLNEISKPNFYENLAEKTNAFLKPIEDEIEKRSLNMCIQKVGSMFTPFFGRKKVSNMEESKGSDQKMFWDFFNFLMGKGIYWAPSPFEASFMMKAHSFEHLKKAGDAILEFLDKQ